MVLDEPRRPLRAADLPDPEPGPGQVLVEVSACGVCRTDLHVVDGELSDPKLPLVVGHQVVGRAVLGGERFVPGDRIGIPWLGWTDDECRYCLSGRENLCDRARFTGYDLDGGYAQLAVADERYCVPVPEGYADEQAAPLLCAGIIGYRSLRRAELPPGGRLGIYGFGASAHLTAQVAVAQGAEVHVLTRGAEARALAAELGAASVGGPHDAPPVPLDAAILFAPVGELVPVALEALGPGGTLAVAGIHLSDVPVLDYQRHHFRERSVRSVTSNTRHDGEEFLLLAERLGLRVATTAVPMDEADRALVDLEAGRVRGAAVLVPAPGG
jgi:propanol-preferring alcohol dehydrogenase